MSISRIGRVTALTLLSTGVDLHKMELCLCLYASSSWSDTPVLKYAFQLNTLDTPSNLFFNLTESPFIRAGRQYSVRVRPHLMYLALSLKRQQLNDHLHRIYGRTQTTALQSGISQRQMYHPMASLPCYWKMLEMSLQAYSLLAVSGFNA